MTYQVQLAPQARRQLFKLSFSIQARITAAVDDLAESPRPAGCKKMRGTSELWRIRVGDYRVIYEIHDRVLLVRVINLGHRREIYR